MNLNNLKPAWRQFVFFNSMQQVDQQEILLIIERADSHAIRSLPGFMISTILFVILTVFCQGG